MSNNVLGNVYSGIIEDVINSSRVDFEEGGVDESVLDTLREVWHQKLTQLNVAPFPWDPAPQQPVAAKALTPPLPPPPPAPVAPPPVPQPHPYSQAHLAPHGQGIQLPMPGMNGNGGVRIKTEPDLDVPIKQEPQNRESEAAARAAQNLKSAYGVRASGSIQAIHRGQPAKPGQPGQPGQQPGQPTQLNLPYGQPLLPQLGPQHPSQTDGAGDEDDDLDAVVMRRGPDGSMQELGRVEIDRLLHKRIMSHAKAMEGGGLMVPLKEAGRHKTARPSSSKPREARGKGQFDGDDDDEDAINSDLDDPEEKSEDDENDEDGLSNIMLCMYDKVQRVKNKWKCTLKDGVLTVNGKEYVFHKATGEYEW